MIYWQISFEKYVPKPLISLLYNFLYFFRRRYLKVFKKSNVSTQIDGFKRRLCAQT